MPAQHVSYLQNFLRYQGLHTRFVYLDLSCTVGAQLFYGFEAMDKNHNEGLMDLSNCLCDRQQKSSGRNLENYMLRASSITIGITIRL